MKRSKKKLSLKYHDKLIINITINRFISRLIDYCLKPDASTHRSELICDFYAARFVNVSRACAEVTKYGRKKNDSWLMFTNG